MDGDALCLERSLHSLSPYLSISSRRAASTICSDRWVEEADVTEGARKDEYGKEVSELRRFREGIVFRLGRN